MGKRTEYEDLGVKGLTTPQHHTQIKADVAWLNMVLRHVRQSLESLRNKDDSLADRIDNALSPIDNAAVYMEDMIYKSLEKPKRKKK